MNVQKTGDYELDHALFNWDSLGWLIQQKTQDEKKNRLTDYKEWYGCKTCDKIVRPAIWYVHKANCTSQITKRRDYSA